MVASIFQISSDHNLWTQFLLR